MSLDLASTFVVFEPDLSTALIKVGPTVYEELEGRVMASALEADWYAELPTGTRGFYMIAKRAFEHLRIDFRNDAIRRFNLKMLSLLFGQNSQQVRNFGNQWLQFNLLHVQPELSSIAPMSM